MEKNSEIRSDKQEEKLSVCDIMKDDTSGQNAVTVQ